MKQKILNFLKSNNKIIFLFIFLIVLDLLLVSTTYEYKDFSLQLPFKTLFGNISYGIILLLGLVYFILFSNKKFSNMKLENIYLCVIIPIGLLYCIANPLGKVTDEDYHARKALALAQGEIFSQVDENGNAISYVTTKIPELVTRTVSSYEEAWQRLNMAQTDKKILVEYNTMAVYSPICHAPQAIGLIISKIFTKDIVIGLYTGRIVNMLVAITLMYFAIKLIPFKKVILVFIGLLPITINEFASLSADAITISMCMFFIAYIFNLKYTSKEKYTKLDYIWLIISTICVSLIKIVYVPLIFMLILLPKEKFNSKKQKIFFVTAIIILGMLLNLVWLSYGMGFSFNYNTGVNSGEQIKYVLTHPIAYVFILFRTIAMYFQNYIVCLNGEGLGHYNAQANVIYIFSSIVLFAALIFANKKEENEIKIDLFTKLFIAVVFFAIIMLIYASIYVQWNVVSNQYVDGIQGRYFLPIIFLTSIFFETNIIEFKNKLKENYIMIFMIFFNLNALANICYTYISGHPIEYLIK